jgi:signal-transduction protein with cAMP-binding, CBS, and nucleotidyltransferase domain
LLAAKFAGIPGHRSVSDTLQAMQQRIPLFTEVNPLMFRELLLGSTIHVLNPGDVVFKRNDYTNSFYTIFNGGVEIQIDDNNPAKRIPLMPGQFFGEMGLLSGRRRTATVLAGKDCVLIETPRRDVLKLLSSVDAARAVIDQTFIVRAIQWIRAAGQDGRFAAYRCEIENEPLQSGASLIQRRRRGRCSASRA